MEKVKQILTTALFLAIILGFSAICLLRPADATSESERRPLAQLPELSWQSVKNGTFFTGFEDYTTDQFPLRDSFRSLKAHVQLSILHTRENNSLAIEDGSIAKIDPQLNTASLENAALKFRYVYETYLQNADTRNFLAIVPDKGYYFARDYGYPGLDYEALTEAITEALPGFQTIELRDLLTLSDYYRTDTHWDQTHLEPVAEALASAMGAQWTGGLTELPLGQFSGVYAGQSALDPDPDDLIALTSPTLAQCTVYDYETGLTGSVYDLEKLSSKDPYEVFLSGSRALLRLDNPNAETDRQLIVFRDSFGSSLIPLLAKSYRSITLVDLRYVNAAYLGNFLEFHDQDVLFLYSTLFLNDSFGLK